MFGAYAWATHPHCWGASGRHWHRGHHHRWWAEVMNDRPPRAERGEVRYLVLSAIADQPRHGYEIIQTIQALSHDQYRPSPGVIYPTLQMLEELGHVVVVETEMRKAYAITDEGRRDLELNKECVRDFYERFEDEPWETYAEDFGDAIRRMSRLFREFKRGARRGRLTPKVMAKIRAAVDEALVKIQQALNNED